MRTSYGCQIALVLSLAAGAVAGCGSSSSKTRTPTATPPGIGTIAPGPVQAIVSTGSFEHADHVQPEPTA